jgi:hypothetical protein
VSSKDWCNLTAHHPSFLTGAWFSVISTEIALII